MGDLFDRVSGQIDFPADERKVLAFWKEARIPPGCRIAIFHGEVNPPDAIAGRRNRFGRGMVPARWVAEHWVE